MLELKDVNEGWSFYHSKNFIKAYLLKDRLKLAKELIK
jgi:hypothetical protein